MVTPDNAYEAVDTQFCFVMQLLEVYTTVM